MKTKEKKGLKLIFIVLTCLIFSWIFADYEIFAATITGTVEDENGYPIGGIEIDYGSGKTTTSNNGLYKVEGNGKEIKYNFTNNNEYDEVLEAVSITYEQENENEEYNIVIVKPESGYEAEYQEIEQMLNNTKIKHGKEIITYNDTNFKYKGSDISNPYQKYSEELYDNRCINLFIVIGTENMPVLDNIAKGNGATWKRNIFYNTNPGVVANPRNMQVTTMFEQVKKWIKEYGKIKEKPQENLNVIELVEDSHAKIKLNEEKSQRVKIKLKRKIEEANIGNFITGSVILKKDDSNRLEITKEEYGKNLDNIIVELINLDNGNIKTTKVQEDGKYGFDRNQEAGRYKLKFKYNGQEFKTIQKESDDVTEENSNKNHIEQEIDRIGFNESNNQIDNEKAKKILNWDEELINIEVETIEFDIIDDRPPTLEEPEGYTDPNKYLNLVLEKRPEFEITLAKQIDIVKVTLADGKVYQENRLEDGTQAEQVKLRQVIMDEELMHGATIEIEYLITATSSTMNIEEIKIIDYLDYEKNKLEYNPDKKLLTEDNKNSDYAWELKNKSELNNIEPSLSDNNEESGGLKEIEYLIGTLQKVDDGKYQTRLVVSKLIGSNLDDEDLLYSNSIEIIEYSNSEGRRMKWENEADLNDKDKNIPGNLNPKYLDDLDYITITLQDTAEAEDVFIIPPFGRKNNMFINLNKHIEQKNDFLNKEEVVK